MYIKVLIYLITTALLPTVDSRVPGSWSDRGSNELRQLPTPASQQTSLRGLSERDCRTDMRETIAKYNRVITNLVRARARDGRVEGLGGADAVQRFFSQLEVYRKPF